MNQQVPQPRRSDNVRQMPMATGGAQTRPPRGGCDVCGEKLAADLPYCPHCGALHASHAGNASLWAGAKTPRLARFLAELADRGLIPVLALLVAAPVYIFAREHYLQAVILVVFVWQLLRDCLAHQRSIGKRLCGLRVVATRGRRRYAWWRLVARRALPAISQTAYCLLLFSHLAGWPTLLNGFDPTWVAVAESSACRFVLLLLAVGYDLVALTVVMINGAGQRLEDILLGTRVVREADHKINHQPCAACGQVIPRRAINCPVCGARNAPLINRQAAD